MSSRVSPQAPDARYTEQDCLAGLVPADGYELWDGMVLVHEPCDGWAGEVGGRITGRIRRVVDAAREGWAPYGEQGYLVQRAPDRILVPDASYVSRARLPSLPRTGFIPLAPDFVVEVRSPTDAWASVIAKCGCWLGHGSRVAWAVDPAEGLVVVLRDGCRATEARAGDVVDASPALPELQVPVSELSEGLA